MEAPNEADSGKRARRGRKRGSKKLFKKLKKFLTRLMKRLGGSEAAGEGEGAKGGEVGSTGEIGELGSAKRSRGRRMARFQARGLLAAPAGHSETKAPASEEASAKAADSMKQAFARFSARRAYMAQQTTGAKSLIS